jgi:hypothetical protein
MIIKNVARLALAAGCLTAIVTLPTADAQMGAPGGYGYAPPSGGYGYGPQPGPYGYGYGPPPGPYGYGPPQGTYPPPGAYGQSAGAYGPSPGAYGARPGPYGPPQGPYAPQTQYVAPPPSAGAAGAQLITNGPQTNPGDVSPSWSAQRNVVESEQYERLLKGNPAFRQARMRKECGRLTIRNFIDSASTALLGTNSTAVG